VEAELNCWRREADSDLIGNLFEFTLNVKNSSCIGSKKELYSQYSRRRRESSQE
jgi:hypothetical protein